MINTKQLNAFHNLILHPTLFLAATALQPDTEMTIDYMYLREPHPKDYYLHEISSKPQYIMPDHLK